jgi:hypothetical protein
MSGIDQLADQMEQGLMLRPIVTFGQKRTDVDLRRFSPGGAIGFMQHHEPTTATTAQEPGIAVPARVELPALSRHDFHFPKSEEPRELTIPGPSAWFALGFL